MRIKKVYCLMLLSLFSGGCNQSRIKTNIPFHFESGEPINLGPNVNSSAVEGSPDISADGKTLYFDSLGRPGSIGDWDIWVSTAKNPHSEWGAARCLPETVNSIYGESGPCISEDGLTLYFASDRPGGSGDFDIYVAARKSIGDPWEKPINLGPKVNSWAYDNHPSISKDGLSLYFDSRRPNTSGLLGQNDIYVTRRKTIDSEWSIPEQFGSEINTSDIQYSPDISSDGLTLFYDSRINDRDVWVTKRKSMDDKWEKGVNIGSPVSTSVNIDTDPSIWINGYILYFVSNRPEGYGQFDIWCIDLTKK